MPQRAVPIASRLPLALCALAAGLLLAAGLPAPGAAQPTQELVQLDFDDAELSAVIDTIARLTDTNFIYDDRVRGRVTIVSPTPMPVDQAYAVFESVLQVKGFTTVRTPGGALKIIPLRDAKEASIETRESKRPPLDRDRFVTRLIPLRYIDAESIVNTLKPLVSKDAAMAAYQPTNTVILTESASNIRRIMAILDSIDVESYKEELAVIRIEYADAASLAQQVSEIYGAEVASTRTPTTRRTSRRAAQQQPAAAGTPARGRVRILTDDRTNSLIVLAARSNLEDVRELVRKLDVPVPGGGRIHVYYLNHANAEELTQTLSSLIGGQPRAPAGAGATPAAAAGQAQALRAAVRGLEEGLSVTADPATNSLVIQASQEGYTTIREVIQLLDVQRPQVLVEALIMEVDVTDSRALGLNWLVDFMSGKTDGAVASLTEAATRSALAGATGGSSEILRGALNPFVASIRRQDSKSTIQAIISASASDAGTNIISAPHILTSDNEEAEIRIGDNIPIISSRVQSAAGVETGLSTSVNVERQDVGVTLRVTPQITEGETLRMEIFQEITAINQGLQEDVGSAEDVGVPLSNRRVENTVVVDDGETVVIGGLISEEFQDVVGKVPWLGDVPVLGWAFKSTDRTLRKVNLLVFLTPHIIRKAEDLEHETIRKREEFISGAGKSLKLSGVERDRIAEKRQEAADRGETYEDPVTKNPVRTALLKHETRYPPERMSEIQDRRRKEREAEAEAAAREAARVGSLYFVQAAILADESEAVELLTDLVDSGWDGTLVSGDVGGRTLFEVRLGPFDSLDEALVTGEAVSRSHGLAPSVLVLSQEGP